MVAISDEPKVFITSLSDYNEGRLVGEWLDLTEYSSHEEVLEAIAAFLEGLDEQEGVDNYEKREEWFITDYEGFPKRFYSEYMGFEEVLQWVEDTQDMDDARKEAYELFLDNSYGNNGGLSDFEEAYQGQYGSEEEFAEQLYDDIYGKSVAGPFENYIDWEAVARDLFMSDYSWEGDGHVFRYN